MIKYLAMAAAARVFSAGPQMRRLYRRLGNVVLSEIRTKEGLPQRYVDRIRLMLELVERHNAIQNGDRLLEVGTGWVHWEATALRLFYNVNATLFDVCDNRLLDIYKQYCSQLAGLIDDTIDMSPTQRERVHSLLEAISLVDSFDALYDMLGFHYVIEPTGTLSHFEAGSFDAVVSCDVLEHVRQEILPAYTQDLCRLLKPGGYSIHQIDIADHLAYYDAGVTKKNYLRYSDKTWDRFFENDVQYFNRVQRLDWLNLFQKAGFILVEEILEPCDIGPIPIDDEYKNLDRKDLTCWIMRVVHLKP
jgi:SAM-dependent methyltransferase